MEYVACRSPEETIFTIGHSTRTLTEFMSLLEEVQVSLVVDVRLIPRSRTNLSSTLTSCRRPLPPPESATDICSRLAAGASFYEPDASSNRLWRNSSFQNYADDAATNAFRDG